MSAKNIQEFVALKVIEHLKKEDVEKEKKDEIINHYETLLLKICKKIKWDDPILEKCMGCGIYNCCEDCISCTDCNRLICDDCSNNRQISVFVHNYDLAAPLEICTDCGYECDSVSLCVSCFAEINEEKNRINEEKNRINEEKNRINGENK